MEMERQRRLHDDHMSGNWSFGSNYQPCSQTRKMSVGLVVDSSAKTKSKIGIGVAAELQTSGNVKSVKVVPTGSKPKGMFSDLGRQDKTPCQESSTPVRRKTSDQNTADPKVLSLPSTNNVPLQPSGNKIVDNMETGSYFANQMFNLRAREANEKNLKSNSNQREGGNHGVIGREEESSYATPVKVPVPEKGTTEQGTGERVNSGNVLRMKLQELLGTVVSSPNKTRHNSDTFGIDADNIKPKSKTNENVSLAAMHKQKTHTRETNSGTPDSKIRRPLTRSVTGKKPQAQKSAPKKQSPLCQSKQAHLDENAFSFVDTWSKRPTIDVSHGSQTFKRKEREICETRPVKTCVVEGVHKDKSQKANDGRKTKAAASNASSFENKKRDSETVKPNTEMKEKTHRQFEALVYRCQPGGNNGTMLNNNVDRNPFAKSSFTKNVDAQYDPKSPTFGFKTTAGTSSPISSFESDKEDLDVDSPPDNSFKTKQTCGSHSKGFSKEGQYNANSKNLAKDLQDSRVITPNTDHKENRYSRSPSQVAQSESSDDDSPMSDPEPIILEIRKENKWSISPCQEEDSESSEDDSPIKGTGDGNCDKFQDDSQQNGLAGAVKLFAVALERIERKIHSTTSRQTAAILLSVSENIQSQLQNAESKIQNEVGKLTNLGKSKRMHSENQCQEQQEQLVRIYEKFKGEVDQHLEKCQKTLEGLETHQIQVKGMVEKQKLSHKKFLNQTEQAIETQLNDAQKRIADVQRLAKEKLFTLKQGIAECLKEGLLG